MASPCHDSMLLIHTDYCYSRCSGISVRAMVITHSHTHRLALSIILAGYGDLFETLRLRDFLVEDRDTFLCWIPAIMQSKGVERQHMQQRFPPLRTSKSHLDLIETQEVALTRTHPKYSKPLAALRDLKVRIRCHDVFQGRISEMAHSRDRIYIPYVILGCITDDFNAIKMSRRRLRDYLNFPSSGSFRD